MFQEAGAPRILVHYPPFGAAKWERLADIAAAGVELTVVVDSVPRPKGSRASSTGAGSPPRSSSSSTSASTEPDRRPSPEPSPLRSSSASCRTLDGRRHQQLPGPLPPRRSRPSRQAGRSRCPPSRDPRRVQPGGAALRPHLGRVDTDAPPDAHDLRQRAARRDVCAPRPERSRDRELRALDRGDRRLRLGTRPGRRRRRLEDVHVRSAPRRRPRRCDRRGRRGFVRVNEEHGYVDVSSLDERPRLGEHLQIVPNHACGCMNLHDGALAVRGGVVDHVIRITGRGLVR